MRRWGADNEERAACTKKAQDAYATARQALNKVEGLEAALTNVQMELADTSAAVDMLERRLNAQAGTLKRLEEMIEERSAPPRRGPVRKQVAMEARA